MTERKLYVMLKAIDNSLDGDGGETFIDDATIKIMRDVIEKNYPNIGLHQLVDKKY